MTMLAAQPAKFARDMAREWDRIRALDDDSLNAELTVTLEATAENIAKLALIVRAKEERGHDLSKLNIGMLPYLRKIARGELLPEVLSIFGHRRSIVRRLANLPPAQQRKYVESGEKSLPKDWEKRQPQSRPDPIIIEGAPTEQYVAEVCCRGVVRINDRPTRGRVKIEIHGFVAGVGKGADAMETVREAVEFILPANFQVKDLRKL